MTYGSKASLFQSFPPVGKFLRGVSVLSPFGVNFHQKLPKRQIAFTKLLDYLRPYTLQKRESEL